MTFLRILLLAIAALLLAAPAVATHSGSYHRDSLGPTTVNIQALAELGISLCDDTLGSVATGLLCGSGGVGAIIALDGSAGNGEADLNHNGATAANPAGGYVWAQGTCQVTQTSAIVPPANGAFSFTCGVDRDDDGFVTNVDLDGSADVDGFDDDLAGSTVSGPYGSGTVPVCFRPDGGFAGGWFGASWDHMFVFIAFNVPTTSMAVGLFAVDVDLSTKNVSCSINNSGHTHSGWSGSSVGQGPSCGAVSCLEGLLHVA